MLLTVPLTTLAGDISQERQQVLRNMLDHDCGACHGLTRKGGLGPALLPENLAAKTDNMLVRTILDGRQGTAMPPWRKFINAQEAAWLVQQLKYPSSN